LINLGTYEGGGWEDNDRPNSQKREKGIIKRPIFHGERKIVKKSRLREEVTGGRREFTEKLAKRAKRKRSHGQRGGSNDVRQ